MKVTPGTRSRTCESDKPSLSGQKPGVRLIPFKLEHMEEIVPQPGQSKIPPNSVEYYVVKGFSYTIINSNEQIISCGGVVPHKDHPEIGLAWSLHSNLFKKHVFSVTSHVRQFLDRLSIAGSFQVLWGHVMYGFNGHGWIKCLGFEVSDLDDEHFGYTLYERIL